MHDLVKLLPSSGSFLDQVISLQFQGAKLIFIQIILHHATRSSFLRRSSILSLERQVTKH